MTDTRILYITNLPTPYKRPRLNAISSMEDVDITVYYSAHSNRRHEYKNLPNAKFDTMYGSSKNISFMGSEAIIDIGSFRRILSFNPDVCIVGGWNHLPAWTALVVSKLKNIPIGVISANTEQGRFSKPVLSWLLPWFDFYLALSDPAEENFTAIGIDETYITVLPNVIDVEKFQASVSLSTQESLRDKWKLPDSGVVLYVGNLEFKKGVHDLIKAISMVNSPSHLLVIGDGPYEHKLKSIAYQLDGVPITFTGQLPNSELPNYYALSDVFVLPTHGDTWGLVVNEALACGTPVVSTTAAGVSGELLLHQENGLVIPPREPNNLAEAVECLLSNDELRAQYGSAGVELSLQYSPRKYAERLMYAINLTLSRTD